MTERAVRRAATASDTRRLGEALGRAVDPLPRGGLVLALVGDLGAGKTTFAGGLVRGLGAAPDTVVASPTFTVARAYRARMPVHHVDVYQVPDRASLEAAGFEEMVGEGRVTVVEWGDRLPGTLPADRVVVTIAAEACAPSEASGGSDAPRRVVVEATGPASERVVRRFAAATEAEAAP